MSVVPGPEAGQPYMHESIDKRTGRLRVVRGVVRDGCDYAYVSSERVDIGDFWKELRRILKSDPDSIADHQVALAVRNHQKLQAERIHPRGF